MKIELTKKEAEFIVVWLRIYEPMENNDKDYEFSRRLADKIRSKY